MKKPFVKALAATMIVAALFSCGNAADNPSQIQPDAAETPLNVVENGIRIRALANGVDDQNREYVDVGYTLDPADTTHVHFEISVTFKESGATGNPSSFVSAAINETAKTVRITKLADFSNVVVVTITDALDGTKSASIEVHLKQKFLGWPSSNSFVTEEFPKTQSQSSNTFWYGLRSVYTYQGIGFSTTFTDALTDSEKAITLSETTVSSSKYYAATVTNYVVTPAGASGVYSKGAYIADGATNSETISYVPCYGTAAKNFVDVVTISNMRGSISIDAKTWTTAQKVAALDSDWILIEVTGTTKATIQGVTSGALSFTIDYLVQKSTYNSTLETQLDSVAAETSTVTF